MGMGDDLVLTPDQDLPERMDGQPDFPIYITLPPYELEDFLNNLSSSLKNKNENFCFFSGGLKYGNIEDILKERGKLWCSYVYTLDSTVADSWKRQDIAGTA